MRLHKTRNGDLPVPSAVAKTIQAAAQAAYPEETCGLLLGRAGRITVARETANVASEPLRHFEIDPQALIDAHRVEREGGLRVMGYFHSHPNGRAVPSETDKARSAKDGKLWAIMGQDGLRFWCDDPDGFCALPYEVIGR